MPKIQINAAGEYFTRYSTGEGPRVIHFHDDIKTYLKKNRLKIGDELPLSWRSDTTRWQYTHGMPSKVSTLSGMVNSKCPVCKKPVFYYTNEYGSKVYFDHAGDTWPKHSCTNTHQNYSLNNILIGINVTRIINKKGYTIVYSDDTIKYITAPFTLKNKKSRCNFFVLQEDNTPNKLIVFDNEKHLEVNIITSHNQTINDNTNINKINNKQELPIEVLVSSFRFEKDFISIDIKNNIDFYKIDIENKNIKLSKKYNYTILTHNGEAKTLIIKNAYKEESCRIIKGYRRLLSRCTFPQPKKKT